MFYVKALSSNGVIICDTDDNSCEEYTLQDLTYIIESDILDCRIYGAYVWNHKCFCTALYLNQSLNIGILTKICRDFREQYTIPKEHELEDYLAMLKIGTKFKVIYSDKTHSGSTFTGIAQFLKIEEDLWVFEDKNQYPCGWRMSSVKAEAMLDTACAVKWKIQGA